MKATRYLASAALVLVITAATGSPLRAQAALPGSGDEKTLIAVLKSDAPVFDKAKACQRLAIVGSAKAVPVLADLLDDERLGDYARQAMEPIDDPRVDDAFRDAMGKLKGRALIGVVNSIGVRRDAKAAGELQKLARNRSSGAAPQALMALGRIATDDAVKTISEVLSAGPAELRPAAADAYLTAVDRMTGQKKAAAAKAMYTAVVNARVGEHFKSAAAYHGIVAAGPAGVPALVSHLRIDHPAARDVALRAARAMPGAEVTAALAAELPKLPTPAQVALIDLLAERGGTDAEKAIIRCADVRKNKAACIAALKALGTAGNSDQAVGALLKPVICEYPPEMSRPAVASLRAIKAEGADEAIVKEMVGISDNSTPCIVLIGIVADRGYAPAVKPLLGTISKAGSGPVRIAGFRALTVLAGPKDLPALVRALTEQKDASVLPHAEKAVALVARRIADPGARADAVLAALAKTGSEPVRCSLIRALGGIGGAEAYEAVAKAARSADAEVKDAAVRSLAGWPDAQAAPALLEVVKTAETATHRVLALRGYVRLLALDAGSDPRAAVRKYAEALALARRPDAKKLVLSGLAGVAHGDALDVVLPCLDEASVRDEAALAAVSIARATLGADRRRAREAMAKLLAVTKSGPVAAQARGVIGLIDRFADAITAWRVAGPYVKAGKMYNQLFDIPFAPEQPGAAGVTWRPLPAGTDPKRPMILDLRKALGGDQRVAYALTWVHSAAAQPARLDLGTDDGVKAWLNGKLVHANNVARAAVPYTDKVNVTLKAGWNPLLLKITQNQIPWEFCARIRRRDGRKLEGIRIDPTHQGPWLPGR